MRCHIAFLIGLEVYLSCLKMLLQSDRQMGRQVWLKFLEAMPYPLKWMILRVVHFKSNIQKQ